MRVQRKKRSAKSRALIYGIGIMSVIGYVLLMDNSSFTDRKTSVDECLIIPRPGYIKLDEGVLILGVGSSIYYDDPALKRTAVILSKDIHRIAGIRVPITTKRDKYSDIQLITSNILRPGQYKINIKGKAVLKAGSPESMKNAGVSLAQLCISHLGKAAFPRIVIEDQPVSEYRGLLLDVARQWHSKWDIRQVIEVCRWYKINYLQLHLTDDQSFTFPTENFPDLPTPGRTYSKKELRELVKFADQNGVTIVPELEVPGHSTLMRQVEPFGLDGIYVINMLDEKVYEALDLLVGEITEVFSTSPYFHIGADECWMEGVGETEAEKIFMSEYNLESHEDIYNYFIVRMNEIVKKHNKKTLVWEGFKGQGSKNVTIPNDITVLAWESMYQRPDSLLNNGYTTINASWQPLYIVPHRSWEPEYIYNWNIWRFENWWDKAPSFNPIQLDSTDQIIGAQMCAWENKPQYDLPAIMYRLPAMSDRIWIPTMNPGDFSDFEYRFIIQDRKLSRVLYPFEVKIEGLEFPGYIGVDQRKPYQFKSTVWVKVNPLRDDLTLRYSLDGKKPNPDSKIYTEEFSITESQDLKIQAFNEKGQLVGYTKWYPMEKQ